MDADRLVAKLQAQQAAQGLSQPRGIRQNNPGNLRPGPKPWRGEVEPIDNYCVFDTAHNGIRALAKLLTIYQSRYGLCTVTTIINRWAPPSDSNNTSAYVAAVCADTGFGPDDWLHMLEPSVLKAMTVAIIRHENGIQPYDDATISAAITDALNT